MTLALADENERDATDNKAFTALFEAIDDLQEELNENAELEDDPGTALEMIKKFARDVAAAAEALTLADFMDEYPEGNEEEDEESELVNYG
jgi:hypothetical protein